MGTVTTYHAAEPVTVTTTLAGRPLTFDLVGNFEPADDVQAAVCQDLVAAGVLTVADPKRGKAKAEPDPVKE